MRATILLSHTLAAIATKMKGRYFMRHKSFLSWRHLLFAVLVLTGGTDSSLAQSQRVADMTALIKQHAVWSPGEFILGKIKANRIVMVADAGHGDPLYSRTVINSVNDWISEWAQAGSNKSPEGLPSKLFLVLEMDSLQASGLRQYFGNGDPLQTLIPFSFVGYQFTTGVLEFYDGLRLIRHRVDAFNENRPSGAQIFFDIVGPEKLIDPSEWTPAKRDSFFVYGRDEYSSSRIKDLLGKTPDAKALIYYGGAHLAPGKTQKLEGKPQSMGYYMAHYLKQDFDTSGGVYICEQFDAQGDSRYFDTGVLEIGKTFAIDGSVFRGAAVDPNAYVPWQGGAIFHFELPRKTRRISMLYSENLVDYVLKNVDFYRNVSIEYSRWVLESWLFYLSSVAVVPSARLNYSDSAVVDSVIGAWKRWRKSTSLDMVGGIASLEYFKKYVDLMRKTADPESIQNEKLLSALVGFRVWFPTGTSQQVHADSMWSYINKYRRSIVVTNLVDLLWIASKSETEKAISILTKETGMNFKTPEEWTSWWETQEVK